MHMLLLLVTALVALAAQAQAQVAPKGPGKGTTWLFDDYSPGNREYEFFEAEDETQECVLAIEALWKRHHQQPSHSGIPAVDRDGFPTFIPGQDPPENLRGRADLDPQCLDCDPVKPSCPLGCQALIDTLYDACDSDGDMSGVTLPDGYFFDFDMELGPTWDAELLQELRVQAGRCGCSAAPTILPSGFVVAAAAVLTVWWSVLSVRPWR